MASGMREAISVRPADFTADAAAILAIDRSFVTDKVYRVAVEGEVIRLESQPLAAPLAKRFPLDDLASSDRPYETGWVALRGARCIGFGAVSFGRWNRRLTLHHVYVDRAHRRAGVAGALLAAIEAHGRALGARHVWLETSSLNVPGIAAYWALGFVLTGVDLTLYDGTPAQGEVALFFSRSLT